MFANRVVDGTPLKWGKGMFVGISSDTLKHYK